jgi:hypothetical protein
LLGLRAALRFIAEALKNYREDGRPDSAPLLIPAIELYLSEPVICEDWFINALLLLWAQLQRIDAIRVILLRHIGDSPMLEKNAPVLRDAATKNLPPVEALLRKVDAAIEKMKPLGGS